MLANRAHDADAILARTREAGAGAVIPPKADRIKARSHDVDLYCERNEVELFFGRLKLHRRVATRCEETARNYLSAVFRAATLVLLR